MESFDVQSLDDLMPVVYAELRRLAARHLARENSGHTLAATALVHELYLRLSSQRSNVWMNREQFFALCARLMRRILIDHVRRRGSRKRGDGAFKIPLEEFHAVMESRPEQWMALDQAIERLGELDPTQAHIVEWHYFMGMTADEMGSLLNLPAGEVYAELRIAKAWLRRELAG